MKFPGHGTFLRKPIAQGIMALVLGVFSFSVSFAQTAAMPHGYDGYMVFMANGVTDPNEPLNFVTDSFFKDVMGWNQEELDQYITEELSRIETKYGIPDPATNPDVSVLTVRTNEAINYRAYTIGGRRVHQNGYPIREGAILVLVTNPDGITLGGDFEGVHLEAGGSIAAGFYNIQVTGRDGKPTGRKMIVGFRSAAPLPPIVALSTFPFVCEAESEEFGVGLAQGINNAQLIGEGVDTMLQSSVRTVLTFRPPAGY